MLLPTLSQEPSAVAPDAEAAQRTVAKSILVLVRRGGHRGAPYPSPWREPDSVLGEAKPDYARRRNAEIGAYLDSLSRAEGRNAADIAAVLRAACWLHDGGELAAEQELLEHVYRHWRKRVQPPAVHEATAMAMRLATRRDLRPHVEHDR
jgi:hypothetical protein